ncbi:hypothetical protein DDE74_19385 [Streptomyces lydicus]|uniref:Uncharacterized protein n=1 Tax=Streptomyces lydicus TaxID=47763 RepID=A0A3S9YD61_9ACTN|nr:hypothetical protein DDE74_19385 [Streptomyces lydicus]
MCVGEVSELESPESPELPESAGALVAASVCAGCAARSGVDAVGALARGGAAVWDGVSDCGCRAVVAGGGVAAVGRACRPAGRDGRAPGCREASLSARSVDEAAGSVRGVDARSGSGIEAAWVPLVAGLFCSMLTVRPPPTRAKAVAAAARRRCFFHRTSWRRRAARPCPVGAGTSASPGAPSSGAAAVSAVSALSAGAASKAPPNGAVSEAPPPNGPASAYRPWPGSGAGASSDCQDSQVAAAAIALCRRWVGGAMSGA